jgi:ATP sulfurylase
MGCSHFIVGRDHTGVTNYYDDDAVPALFNALPGIGITPVFFPTHVYDAADGIYVPEARVKSPRSISGAAARASLPAGEHLPDWYIHPVVQEVSARRLKMGQSSRRQKFLIAHAHSRRTDPEAYQITGDLKSK